MKSFTQTSPTTLTLTDEDGNTSDWEREFDVRGSEKFDFNQQLKIKGTTYVKRNDGED